MTKTQLQATLAEETGTDRKMATHFLNVLVEIAYRETRKKGEFVLPGIGKLVKQKRKARIGINPKTGEKLKIAAKTVVKMRLAKAAKDAIFGEGAGAAAAKPVGGAAKTASGASKSAGSSAKPVGAAKASSAAKPASPAAKAAPAKASPAKPASKAGRR